MAHAFNSLSIELNQTIGTYLQDKDLASYRLICHSTNDAIDYDNGSFWRTRFLDTYDPPPHVPSKDRAKANDMYKKEYQTRQRTLQNAISVQMGNTPAEIECVRLARKLINESFTPEHYGSKKVPTESKNVVHIRKMIMTHALLDGVLRRKWRYYKGVSNYINPELLAVQLALTNFSLTSEPQTGPANVWDFLECQYFAYSSEAKCPIFKGPNNLEVDISWTLHVASFFRNYLLGTQEIVARDYAALQQTQRPQYLKEMLSETPRKLGKHWKGSYAYVSHEEVEDIRLGLHQGHVVQDHLNGENDEDGFQTLQLDFPKTGDETWPPLFENILKSRGKTNYRTAVTRAQRRTIGSDVSPPGEPVSFRFEGQGIDNADGFKSTGWLNPLPKQHGIPGWQRMTMMKYWLHSNGEVDRSSLWAYEGVVLPGGQIMLGRWWHPVSGPSQYSGPFVFWNVDASVVVDED